MGLELSVIICAHNPRPAYLTRVLTALREQTLSPDRWELLLVDNRSTEPLSGKWDLGWHPHGRHLLEENLGLTPARLNGISNASTDVLIFVDDDNVLDQDYLESALKISAAWPKLGAWGGEVVPDFETPPQDWTKQFWHLLAIRDLNQDKWSNLTSTTETAPCGAGMCVRTQVAESYAALVRKDRRRMELDRKGGSLVSCGDTDLAFHACDLGLGIGLFRALRLTHLMPAGRLEESYLLKLVHGIAYSGLLLQALRGQSPTMPSRSQRLFQIYTRSRLASRERRFHDALEAGKAEAIAEISRWPNGRSPAATAPQGTVENLLDAE